MAQEIIHNGWRLVDKLTIKPVTVGEVRKDFRGDSITVTGGRSPHKPSSQGFIHTGDGAEFYAGVVDAKWLPI